MKIKITIVIVFIIGYITMQSINYSIEYNAKQYEKQITQLEEELTELSVEENLQLSRQKAIEEYKLELNNNVYYLEEENNG